jgi:hypothetical protein
VTKLRLSQNPSPNPNRKLTKMKLSHRIWMVNITVLDKIGDK